MNNPLLLPRLAATAATAERGMTAAIAERLGLRGEHAYPAVLAAVTGTALRVALMRWAADEQRAATAVPETAGGAAETATAERTATGADVARSLADHVHEAFGMVAAGLKDPVSPTP
jgi:hypothetical protein